MNKELHLILIWQKARYKEKEILDDIQKNLKIAECIEIEWDPKFISSNFTRFYGVKLPNRSFKEKECGRGKFLLITVWDENPKYEYVETSRGFEKVNTNIFYLKDKYRSWTNGGHKIHSTNTIFETNHDITLLLGKNYEDYVKDAPLSWNGLIRSVKRDLTGCNGWKNFEEFFYTLNATINYCVLRNYEILPTEFKSDLHGDIDILTDNYNDIVFLTGATPVFKQKYRVHHRVKIAGKNVLFDFRFLGDNYYCSDFEKNILYTRELNSNNIYIPNKENAFYSLVYHCLIHKRKIAFDYYFKVKTLYEKLSFDNKYNLANYKYPFDLYFQMLNNFMKQKNYSYTKPLDLSVIYNDKYNKCEEIVDWLYKNYEIKNIEPYMVGALQSDSGYIFFVGEYNNTKIFIKWGGLSDSAKNEYKIGKILYDCNPNHFIKPILFNFNNNKNFVATEFIEGTILHDLIYDQQINESQKDNFLMQLEEIALCLEKTNIVHRDIHPNNIIVAKDGNLKLIDLQFAINSKTYRVGRNTIKNWYKLRLLGNDYRPKIYCWDDMFSINKIIQEFGKESVLLKNRIGKNKIDLFYFRILFRITRIYNILLKIIKRLFNIIK